MKKLRLDKARLETDRKLIQVENDINSIYKNNSNLLSIQKEYIKYMAFVKKKTEETYNEYVNEKDKDIKAEKKKAYENELRRYTIESKEYNSLIDKITSVIAEVNQEAIDISNQAMIDVYVINYNQVAEDCKEIGIKVNG